MKKPMIFNLDFEVIEELDKLENRSSFLNTLLLDYFNTNKPLVEKKEELIKQAENLLDESNKIELQISDQEEQIKLEREAYQKKEKEWEDSDERWERIKSNQAYTLTNYDIPKDQFNTILDDYMIMLRFGQVKNLIEYTQLKGIEKKKKRENE